MDSGETPRWRSPWAVVTASWLGRGAQGMAAAAAAASLSRQGSAVRLPRQRHRVPILLQHPSVRSGAQGPLEQVQPEAKPSTASDQASNGQAIAVSPTNGPPKLHFCDDTNEPEDVCNAQWLVVSRSFDFSRINA